MTLLKIDERARKVWIFNTNAILEYFFKGSSLYQKRNKNIEITLWKFHVTTLQKNIFP